jgi:hypothetical protein
VTEVGYRKIRQMLAVSMVAGALVAAAPSSPAGACSSSNVQILKQGIRSARSGSNETVALRTLHIEAKVPKKVYKVGEIIKMPVEVTRPAKEDPLGQGIPMDRPYVMPAEGVNLGVGLVIGDVFLPGFGVTDEEGKVTVQIRVEKWVKPAVANASFYSWKTQVESVCARVEEFGFRPYPSFFKVTTR